MPAVEAMTKFTLQRLQTGHHGTFGVLSGPGLAIVTAELPWRENERRVSCIPTGTYMCEPWASPKFGRVFIVAGVVGRDAVLFHPGNLAGAADLGLDTHTEGCILTGTRFALFKNSAGRMQRAVSSSAAAFRSMALSAKNKPFELTIC